MWVSLILTLIFLSAASFAATEPPVMTPTRPLSRILPILFYTPDTHFGFGGFLIHNLDEPPQGDPSQLIAFATLTQKSQIIAVAEPKVYWDSGRWEWSGKLSAQDFPSEYYGRGALELPPARAEAYKEKRLTVETRLKNIFFAGLFWELEIGAGWQIFAADHEMPPPNLAGEFAEWGKKGAQQTLALGLGHDNRSSRVRPTSGHLLRIFYKGIQFRTAKPRDSTSLQALDWKHYLPLDPRQSLALQFHAAQMSPDDVPFYLLPGLGGNQVLRGFYGNQFRDEAISFAQMEWRALWKEDWGYRIFGGVGAHAERLAFINRSSGKTAGGVGIDYFLDPKSMNNLRLDLGLSQDNVGVYFLYGNAF